MQKNIIIILGLILTGCLEKPLTKEETLVRTITPVLAQNCENLGIVKTSKLQMTRFDDALASAMLQIRKDAVRLGGNSIIIIYQTPDGGDAKVMAEVYSCKT